MIKPGVFNYDILFYSNGSCYLTGPRDFRGRPQEYNRRNNMMALATFYGFSHNPEIMMQFPGLTDWGFLR